MRYRKQCITWFILMALFICLTHKEGWSDISVRAYIANNQSNTVSVIDTSANTVIATIPVGQYPKGVAVNPAGTRVYVTNYSDNTVSVIDISKNTVIATVPVSGGYGPIGVVVNPAGNRAYVINSKGSSSVLSVIDTSSNTVSATVSLGYAQGLAFNPSGTRLYVAGDGLYVIDTSTNILIANITGDSFGVVASPAGTRLYMTNLNSNTLSVYDTSNNTLIATVSVGRSPMGVSMNPSGTRVYVANWYSDTVSVIDALNNTVVATVPVGSFPMGVSVTPDGNSVYVTNSNSNTVSVINAANNTVKATVTVGSHPESRGSNQFIGTVSTLANTTSTLMSSVNPSTTGASVTFTSTVIGDNPTGTVTFMDGSTTLGSGTLSGGIATYTTSSLSDGSHSIKSVYGGDSKNASSTSSLTQTVNKSANPASKAKMSSPPEGSNLSSTTQKFVWNQTGADEYRLNIGTFVGAVDIYSQSQGTNNFVIVDNLPANGITLYVRLFSKLNGTWEYNEYTYKSFTDTSTGGNKGNTNSSTTDCKSGTLYNVSFLGGNSGSVCLSVNKVSTPSGNSKLRGTATWKGFATTAGLANGFTFTIAWENYEGDSANGLLYENDPAHGALFILAYAFPSDNCSGGASFFAVIEMPNAVSLRDLGSSITFTPLFGQICGTKITSLNSYALTRQ